jgi:hypothetical protein
VLSPAKKAAAFSQDLLLHAEHPVPSTQPHQLGPLVGAQTFSATLIDVGLVHPVAQARLRDPDVGGDLRDRLGMLPSQLDRPAPELRWMGRWHSDSFPRKASASSG